MNNEPEIFPPRWAQRLLEWYCKPELLEDLQGDLNEYFQRNVTSVGATRAKLIYVIDVLKFFRIYTVRKLEFINHLINWLMLSSYIKSSGRNIIRNKLFSAINIVGLAVSMSIGLLMITVLSDTLSYDQFHKDHDRIYRVISRYEHIESKERNFNATTSLKAGYAILENFSGVDQVAIFRSNLNADVTTGDKTVPLGGYWASESIFKVFSFELLAGDARTALREPFSLVLTEKASQKLFGSESPLGKIVSLNQRQYTVTGLVKDVPKFSHIQFEILGSLSTRNIIAKEDKSHLRTGHNMDEMSWQDVWSTWVYLTLQKDANPEKVKAQLDELCAREDRTMKNARVTLGLQPLDDIMLGQHLGNQIGPVLGQSSLWVFGALTFVVILSACFNYANLSIARSLRRTREVGIRKVIGAQKLHLFFQFIVEAVIISISALAISFLLFLFLKPYFLSIDEKIQRLFSLEMSGSIITYFVVLAIFTGIAAGFFPALFFTKINAVTVLKDSSVRGLKKTTARKALIVFQYCISIIFITSTTIMLKQYKHFVAFDLGFTTSNILNVSLQGANPDAFIEDLNWLPEVVGTSRSIMIPGIGNYWGTHVKSPTTPNDSTVIYFNSIDENYLPLHDHKLLAGRNFSYKNDSAKETEVIVNQAVLRRFDLDAQKPETAIGRVLKIGNSDVTIIGVIKNFSYGRANKNEGDSEVMFRYSRQNANYLNIKVESSDLIGTHKNIEAIWKKHDPVHPFEAKFYSEALENAFSGIKASVEMVGLISFLAICIASLGLLGMVVFTTETRLREISIRKVLGANEVSLLYLLSKGFFLLLIISAMISLPITYLVFDQILFQEIANHAPISVTDLTIGLSMIFLLALIMISLQTFKATRTNPAEVLKSE